MSSETEPNTSPGEAMKSSFAKQISQPGAVVQVIKHLLVFWGMCIIAGALTAVGLANAGMETQDAFNSGLIIAFLPLIVFGVISYIFFIFG